MLFNLAAPIQFLYCISPLYCPQFPPISQYVKLKLNYLANIQAVTSPQLRKSNIETKLILSGLLYICTVVNSVGKVEIWPGHRVRDPKFGPVDSKVACQYRPKSKGRRKKKCISKWPGRPGHLFEIWTYHVKVCRYFYWVVTIFSKKKLVYFTKKNWGKKKRCLNPFPAI